jgi:hypothetical protein
MSPTISYLFAKNALEQRIGPLGFPSRSDNMTVFVNIFLYKLWVLRARDALGAQSTTHAELLHVVRAAVTGSGWGGRWKAVGVAGG